MLDDFIHVCRQPEVKVEVIGLMEVFWDFDPDVDVPSDNKDVRSMMLAVRKGMKVEVS